MKLNKYVKLVDLGKEYCLCNTYSLNMLTSIADVYNSKLSKSTLNLCFGVLFSVKIET